MASRVKTSLATYERLSPNCTKPRTGAVRRMTPHHAAGNMTIESTLAMFVQSAVQASANYAIGTDGRIGLGVEETNRAWTTASSANDHEAITVEIANNGGAPNWSMSDAAINAWINLTVDVAKFYGFKKVNYQAKPANITVAQVETWIKTWAKSDEMIITIHRWYYATECPGPYFLGKLPSLVTEINNRLSNTSTTTTPSPSATKTPEALAREVLAGQWGNGQDRINSLTAAGYNATAVQNAVNAIVSTTTTTSTAFKEYFITITTSALNIRKGPGISYGIVKTLVNDKNTYTIVEEATGAGATKWGKLKGGLGWIALDFTKKK